ncbi:hypothetical protein [Shewanella atlantica]|uniref:Transporter substrate-binding domain-containing protein n=1 Tax=Shewanella atlantica TaxID=271099 RepID=A0A3S0IIM1_9GAMM|nr:hypothetical protein [Shewanella atlantica]RTR33354.1 hypothetical protein EKG39_06305 [Shewanella atlantica]
MTPSILTDSNEVISSNDSKVVYQGQKSVAGLILVAVSGRKYTALEPSLSNDVIHRFDVNREQQALSLLLNNRADFTIQPKSLADALIEEMGGRDRIFFSPEQLQTFTWHLMITSELSHLHQPLNEFIDSLENERWARS